MADPFSVAGSAVGVISLGISVCQGLVKYYSAFKGQDDEHRLSSPRYRHSVSVEKVEQNIVACATSLTKLKDTLSKCTQESTADDLRHKLRTTSRRMLYPFKQKTLHDLSAAVSQCQSDLETAMQILQIDQLSTVESSNAVILENTATTRDISEVNWREVRAMREDIQRLMEVALPALVLSSMRPQSQVNAGNAAATAFDISSASRMPRASHERSITGRESCYTLCRCRPRTKFIERLLELGPITLVRTSKSKAEHNEDCRYFVTKSQDQGAGLKFQVRTMSRKWNVMAALNYNHAVGAFSVNPTLVFKATLPDDHPLFLITKDIVRGKSTFDAGLRSIRLLFQNGEAAVTDVNNRGANLLQLVPECILDVIDDKVAVDGAFQEWVGQLIMTFMALGVNLNERVEGLHTLVAYLFALVFLSPHKNDIPFLYDLYEKIAIHPDCDYEPGSCGRFIKEEPIDFDGCQIHSVTEAVKEYEYLGSELGFNDLCLAVLRKSLSDIESILSKSPSAISCRTAFKQTVLHLAADWPVGMAVLLSRGGRSIVHTLDSAKQSPLDRACHNNCASVVRILLQADTHVDLKLMYLLEEQSKWDLFQIFIEELARRRSHLLQLAETELSADTYRNLEISVEHPMNDIKTVLVLSQFEEHSIHIPEALEYYGIDGNEPVYPANCFGTSFGNTIEGADVVHKAGFFLDVHVDVFQRYQLHGMRRRFFEAHWFWDESLAQHLDKMLWLLEKGLTFYEHQIHHMFHVSNWTVSLEDVTDRLTYSSEDRMSLLSQLLLSRSGVQHTCPCCIDVCSTILATLRSKNQHPYHINKHSEGEEAIFARLLSMVEACNSKLDPEFWVWAMPRLIHSVLYEACNLTHSLSCCKSDRRISDEDDVKEKHEEEEYMRSRLSTLTEELTAEYEESSMLLSDFLRDRVVVRALELLDGEDEASPEDRKRLREIGVVLEDESESERDANKNCK